MPKTMFHRLLPITALLALLAGCATTPSSGDTVGESIGFPSISSITYFLENRGYTLRQTREPAPSFRPYFEVRNDRENFELHFGDCLKGDTYKAWRCTTVEFNVQYPTKTNVTLSTINRLNSRYWMARVYLLPEGYPGITMSLDTTGASSSGNLEDSLALWISSKRTFEADIGFN